MNLANATMGFPAVEASEALPDGWQWARLGDVCEFNPRRAPGLGLTDDDEVTFVPMPAVDARSGTISFPEVRRFAEVKRGYTVFADGDVIFAKITPCMQNGKHAVCRGLRHGVGFGSTEFHVLRPGPDVLPEWIHAFLRQPHVLEKATGHFTGAVGQQRLPEDYLAELPFALPPLAEQRHIIRFLQAKLAAVESARVAAEGRLEAAKKLSDAYKRDIFDSLDARKWPIQKLGEAADIVGGIQKTPHRAPHYHSRPYLTVRNVQRGSLDLTHVERFEVTPDEVSRLLLMDQDILIVEGNGSIDQIGRNALFIGDGQEWIHQNHIIRVRLHREKLLPEFVSYFLNSEAGRAQMVEKARTSSGLFTLSAGKVRLLEIPAPDIQEQELLTRALQKRRNCGLTIVESCATEIKAIKALPSALLRQAFWGKMGGSQ